MVGRAAFTEEVLAELGWLTINYSGLEDLLVTCEAADALIAARVGPAQADRLFAGPLSGRLQ